MTVTPLPSLHQPASWEDIAALAKPQTSARWILRPGEHPSTAPVSTAVGSLEGGSPAPVLLYRDSNSWCPYCERVWFALEEKGIPYEVEFIDLSNKPKWYTDQVPTTLVPAAHIHGQLIYESKDILLALEEAFEHPLLPTDPGKKAEAIQYLHDWEKGGFQALSYKFVRHKAEDPEELQELLTELEHWLDQLEGSLTRYPGPYFLEEFSLLDILHSPHLDRLAANLPVYRHYSLKHNPRYPNLTQWFATLSERPAYQRVRSDSTTNNLLLRRRFGLKALGHPDPLPSTLDSVEIDFRAEAAARLSDNHEAAIGDILKNAGILDLSPQRDIFQIRTIIDITLRRLAGFLLKGEKQPWAGSSVGGQEGQNPADAAIAAITLSYIRNRICAPRDMRAGAATALRIGAEKLSSSIY